MLSNVVALWNAALAPIDSDADPAKVLEDYIRMKVDLTHRFPAATRLFAREVLNGWPHLSTKLERETRAWTVDLANEIDGWIRQGRISPLDPYHLIFVIWAATQRYAESETQVKSVYGKKRLTRKDHDQLADSLVTMVLRICGLQPGSSAA